jgi:hypothetical protein
VTPNWERAEVDRPLPRTGICIVRLERQADGILISLLMSVDGDSAPGQRRRSFVGVDEAIRHVREFVEAFRTEGSAPLDERTDPP